MENEFLFDIAKEYFMERNIGNRKWNFMTYWYGEHIPEKQLESASKWFADYKQDVEKPIILMMDNCFGLVKEGILVTNINIYYRLKKSYKEPTVTKVLKLEEIKSIDIDCKMFGAWLMINNKKEALISRYSTGVVVRETNVLRETLQIIVKEIQLR